tara:strand:- start:1651 stop:2490 length:840 start_codon:yes stop_codon:yes gene_type:complete
MVQTARDYDNLKPYFSDFQKYPLLNQEQEINLGTKIQEGDKESREKAREELTTSNLKLVISIAKKYLYYGLPLEDLIEEGNIGLMKAVDKFDPNRGVKFGTHATWWIRQAVTRSISDKARTIRHPVYLDTNLAKIRRIQEAYYKEHGKTIPDEKLAEETGFKLKKIRKYGVLQRTMENISLEETINTSNEPSTELDHTQLQQKRINELKNYIGSIDCLDLREKEIIEFRYGLIDGEGHTLEETGEIYNLTRERIRQIERDILKKLRAKVKEEEIQRSDF